MCIRRMFVPIYFKSWYELEDFMTDKPRDPSNPSEAEPTPENSTEQPPVQPSLQPPDSAVAAMHSTEPAPPGPEGAAEVPSEPASAAASESDSESAPKPTPTATPSSKSEKSQGFELEDVITRPGWAGITREHALPPANVPYDSSEGDEQTAQMQQEEPEGIQVRAFGLSDTGLVREQNEDNYATALLGGDRLEFKNDVVAADITTVGLVCAVCDGMGGAAAGEVASSIAVDTVLQFMQSASNNLEKDDFARNIVRAVESAGMEIFKSSQEDFNRLGMGTTATVAGVLQSTLFVGQVGDSRAYIFRRGALTPVTKDQSLVSQLVETGHLTEEEAQSFEHTNIVLQALGTAEEVMVDLTYAELYRGDRLLICSDGLCGLVHTDLMEGILREIPDPKECCNQLKELAYSAGGHDNITVVVIDFRGKKLKPSTVDSRVFYQPYTLQNREPAKQKDDTRNVRHSKMLEDRHADSLTPAATPASRGIVERALSRAHARKRPPFSKLPLSFALLLSIAGLVFLGVALRQISYRRSNRSLAAPTTARSPDATTSPKRNPVPPKAYVDVQVFCDIPETELWIDGDLYGPFPSNHIIYLQLAPGKHVFEAKALDEVEGQVSIDLGQTAQSVILKRLGSPEQPAQSSQPAEPGQQSQQP